MDQPNKLLATATRRGMSFIDLPDHIVHHILSYLSIEDLARLSVASTRCRELCRSVPSLIIDNLKYTVGPAPGDRSEGFSNFVDRFLGIRLKLGLEMQRFRLRWSFKHPRSLDEKYRVETWLYYASYSNVEELDLEFIPQLKVLAFAFALPVSVLSCNSLRSLKVDMHAGMLKLPAFGFIALQTLSLKSVRIEQESFGEWVSTCCNSLRELYLENLYGLKTININSSSLEVLKMNFNPSDICLLAPKLRLLAMIWFPISSGITSLIVTAPNLKQLTWLGYLNHHYSVQKCLHLQRAAICLRPPPQLLRENEDFTGLNFGEILRSVSNAKTLSLSGQFVEVLFMRGCLPFSLDDLRELTIYVSGGLNGTLVPAIASLLKGTPALEILSIMPSRLRIKNNNANPLDKVTHSLSSKEIIGFNMEYWESQNLRFTDQLKRAAIKVCAGQNVLELLRYLLKHAKELKRMDLYYSPPLPSRISIELNKLKNSSPAVHFYYRMSA